MRLINRRFCVVMMLLIGGVFIRGDVEAANPAKKSPPVRIRDKAKLLKKYVLENKKSERVFILNDGRVISNRISAQYEILAPVETEADLTGKPNDFSVAAKGLIRQKAWSNYKPDITKIEKGVKQPAGREVIDVTPDGQYFSLKFVKERDDMEPCTPGKYCMDKGRYLTKYVIARSDGTELWSTEYEDRYDANSHFTISPAGNFVVRNNVALYNMKGERIGTIGRPFDGAARFSENGEYIVMTPDGEDYNQTLVLFSSEGTELWSRHIKEENPIRLRDRPSGTAYIISTAISPDGGVIVAGTFDYVYLFDNKGEVLSRIKCHYCTNFSFYENRKLLIVKGRARFYDLINLKDIWWNGPQKYGYDGKSFYVGDITSDGKFIALGCENRVIRKNGGMAGNNYIMILDETGRLVWKMPLRERRVTKIRFVKNETQLVVEAQHYKKEKSGDTNHVNNVYLFDVSEITGGAE